MATWIHFFPQNIPFNVSQACPSSLFLPSGKNLPHEKRWMGVMGVWITTIHPKIVDVPHLQDDHMTQCVCANNIVPHVLMMGLIFQPSSFINLIST
jgi:hypothetical protein